jgi:hypothetical protein
MLGRPTDTAGPTAAAKARTVAAGSPGTHAFAQEAGMVLKPWHVLTLMCCFLVATTVISIAVVLVVRATRGRR